MSTKALTKEQKKQARMDARAARASRMKKELGETITRKVALGLGGYASGIAPMTGPVRTSTALTVVGYAGALAMGGKVGAAMEGIGDAGFANMTENWGREKRASLARDHFLRGEFFSEASGNNPDVRSAERRAFAAGRVTGVRDGVRRVAGAMRDVDAGEAAGVPSSAAELVTGQLDERADGQ